VDLIKDYPRPGTVMLGLLLLDENFQSRGLGKLLYEKVEDFSRNELSAEKIRIGVNDSNPVHGFWEKMGFTRTGESRPHEGLKRKSIVWVMEK
jgi:ribosomal protein S18 acetylase RimI-like enzyme